MDDDHDNADTLNVLVSLWGYEAHSAYYRIAGLDEAATFAPDVMLIDISTPDLDGNPLAVALRHRLGAQPILIAISGQDRPAIFAEAKRAGFGHYLVKPINLDHLQQLGFRRIGRTGFYGLSTTYVMPKFEDVLRSTAAPRRT